MSHSKKNKRGKSLYIESWNPSAKKFINTCALCGAVGYNPTIEEDGFIKDGEDGRTNYEHAAMHAELTRTLKPLPLDFLGRCPDCAARMERQAQSE